MKSWREDNGQTLPSNSKEKAAFKDLIKSWQRKIDGFPVEVRIYRVDATTQSKSASCHSLHLLIFFLVGTDTWSGGFVVIKMRQLSRVWGSVVLVGLALDGEAASREAFSCIAGYRRRISRKRWRAGACTKSFHLPHSVRLCTSPLLHLRLLGQSMLLQTDEGWMMRRYECCSQ